MHLHAGGEGSHQLGKPGAFRDQTKRGDPHSSGRSEGVARQRGGKLPSLQGEQYSSAKGNEGFPLCARPGGGPKDRQVTEYRENLGSASTPPSSLPPHISASSPRCLPKHDPSITSPSLSHPSTTPASSAPQPLTRCCPPPPPPHLLLGALSAAALLLEILLI